MIGIFVFTYGRFPPQIPLFYSYPWGEDQLVDLWMIGILPLVLNVLYFFNLWLYKKLFPGNFLIKKMFYYLNLFLIISITFIFIKIIVRII